MLAKILIIITLLFVVDACKFRGEIGKQTKPGQSVDKTKVQMSLVAVSVDKKGQNKNIIHQVECKGAIGCSTIEDPAAIKDENLVNNFVKEQFCRNEELKKRYLQLILAATGQYKCTAMVDYTGSPYVDKPIISSVPPWEQDSLYSDFGVDYCSQWNETEIEEPQSQVGNPVIFIYGEEKDLDDPSALPSFNKLYLTLDKGTGRLIRYNFEHWIRYAAGQNEKMKESKYLSHDCEYISKSAQTN